jgi:hypothetical protein
MSGPLMAPFTRYGYSPMGGAYVATCDNCRTVCAGWDDEDVDEYGALWHECAGADESWGELDPSPFSVAGAWLDDRIAEREAGA